MQTTQKLQTNNMENNKQNTKNEKRVVLNLSTSQTTELNHFLNLDGIALGSKHEHYDLAVKLSKRIEKTLAKQAGEALEQAMPALTQAIQGAINESEAHDGNN